jgi:hypothetical protein
MASMAASCVAEENSQFQIKQFIGGNLRTIRSEEETY